MTFTEKRTALYLRIQDTSWFRLAVLFLFLLLIWVASQYLDSAPSNLSLTAVFTFSVIWGRSWGYVSLGMTVVELYLLVSGQANRMGEIALLAACGVFFVEIESFVRRRLNESRLGAQSLKAANVLLERQVEAQKSRLKRADNSLHKQVTDTRAALLELGVSHGAVLDLEAERLLWRTFVTTLSRDLKTPLSKAKMATTVLQTSPRQPKDDSHLITLIQRNLARMSRVILNLVDASRLRSGQALKLTFVKSDLSVLVTRMISELSMTYGDRFIERLPSALLGFWSVDAVERIIDNLVTNAVKYGDRTSPITISLFERGEFAEIQVHNFGPVIPPKELETIFTRFVKGYQENPSDSSGWRGLGPAVVNGLAESHGGNVHAESSTEAGTTFVVRLSKQK